MAHQSQLESKKYRNWVKAGLGLKYTKEGLEPFCDQLVRQQHADILNKVKQKFNLSTVSCGHCNLRTLQPDHVRTKSRQCPLGQSNCNCQYPGGKVTCHNNVCGAIYDEVIKLHASTPPAPLWKNSEVKYWCTEPWAIGKCFINAPGYHTQTKPSEFDCAALLHVLLNNKDFQDHLQHKNTGNDVFTKVRTYRNTIFHSCDMELEDNDVTVYIDDMITVLEDGKELVHRSESKAAVLKLQELKNEAFRITTDNESEVFKDAMEALQEKVKELDEKISEAKEDMTEQTIESKHELRQAEREIIEEITRQKNDFELRAKQMKIKIDQCVKDGKVSLMKVIKGGKCKIEATKIKMEEELKGTFEKMMKLSERPPEKELAPGPMRQKQNPDGYIEWKAGFQKKLVDEYMKHAMKASALPLQQEKYQREIWDVYVPPWMTVEKKSTEDTQKTEEKSISMDQLFIHEDEKPARNIYVIGEAGSGKSSFCKMLVYYWCLAHSKPETKARESNIVKEIGNYEFLFYITLQHYRNCSSIKMMLEEKYPDSYLNDLLQAESSKCLILLDGLDEWTPTTQLPSQYQTIGLPTRDVSAKYTIVTTSREWKFDTLKISDSEVDKKIKLKGIDDNAIEFLSQKTIKILNESFHISKTADNFKSDLQKSPIADEKHVPMILQQLICLWFDDKLHGTSKCAVYSSMLDLYFKWKTLKKKAQTVVIYSRQNHSKNMSKSRLPRYLSAYKACVENHDIIVHLTHLAFKTLLEENTLTFEDSTLQSLEIPDEVKNIFLEVGILSEDQTACIFASEEQPFSFSFVHKSMQEYLAALHVAIEYEKMVQSSNIIQQPDGKLTENGKQFVRKYFESCTTVKDILEQSNVFIMLSGLEPHLLPYISELIYNITTKDNQIENERKIIEEDAIILIGFRNAMISDIQECIENCIKESLAGGVVLRNSVYIADIVLFCTDNMWSLIEKQIFRLHHVLSLEIILQYQCKTQDFEKLTTDLKLITECDSLKSLTYVNESNKSMRNDTLFISEKILKLATKNTSTLEVLKFQSNIQTEVQLLIKTLHDLHRQHHLTSLQIIACDEIFIPHEDCRSLSAFVEQTTHLQQICLVADFRYCETHELDLTKHKLLHNVEVQTVFEVAGLSNDNLETCKIYLSDRELNQQCECLYNACKLRKLCLDGCYLWTVEPSTLTEKVIRLLPSLTNLSTLEFSYCTFTDNIISRPSDMKQLKILSLNSVEMSIKTWREFIDSLPALPQTVQVIVFDVQIEYTRMIEPFRYWDSETNEETVKRYIRGKTEHFRVTYDGVMLNFVTKKTNV